MFSRGEKATEVYNINLVGKFMSQIAAKMCTFGII